MLQRTGRFWSKDFLTSNNVTTLKHSHILSWLGLQLIFTCSLDWYQHWRGGASVILLALRMLRKSWKGLHKMASRNVSNTFKSLTEAYSCTRELFWRKCSLNDCTIMYFSEINWFREHLCNYLLHQYFSTFVRPRPGKFFFHKTRAQSQQIYSSVPFLIFLSSYIKLT